MVMERQAISAEGFFDIVDSPGYEDRSIELVEGEIVEMSKPSGLHGQITMRLGAKLFYFAEENGLGIVTAAETGFILERNPDGGDTVRGLDIGFIRGANAPAVLPDHLVDVAPDLAVEVISPSNKVADMHRKIRQLLAAGTKLGLDCLPRKHVLSRFTRILAPSPLRATTCSVAAMFCPALKSPVREIFPALASS